MTLAWYRKLPESLEWQHRHYLPFPYEGEWNHVGEELYGKTIGIVSNVSIGLMLSVER